MLKAMEAMVRSLKDINRIADHNLVGITNIESAIVAMQEEIETVVEISKGVYKVIGEDN